MGKPAPEHETSMRRLMTQFAIVMLAAATAMLLIERHLVRPLLAENSAAARKLQREGQRESSKADQLAAIDEGLSRALVNEDVSAEHGPSAIGTTGESLHTAATEQERLVDDGEYVKLYGGMSQLEMRAECESLSSRVMLGLHEAIGELVDSGQYEVVGFGNLLPQVLEDRSKLVAYQLVAVPESAAKEIRKIELLEADYPNEYDLHRKAMWLSDKLQDRAKSGAE
jgi:hypothetical protein